MGILDTLLGRTKPAQANLDALFGLPGAVITLQASEGLIPTNSAGVCFKPAAGQPFVKTTEEMTALLGLDKSDGSDPGGSVRQVADKFGYSWVVVTSSDFDLLVTQVHVINTTLEGEGYGPQLLCSVFGFRPEAGGATGYLVYLYKRGAFYPFFPLGAQQRNHQAELKLEIELKSDLKVEPDKERWMPLWGMPVS